MEGVARRAMAAEWAVDLRGLRVLGAGMIGLGLVLPHLPHNPGLPCPLRTTTGVPCPLCGMSTSVKAVLGGHVQASIAANPFGVVAVVVAVLLLLLPQAREFRLKLPVLVACAATSWVWELNRFHII